jgi:hypothetical protein
MTKFDDFALIIEPYITLENALDYERQMDRWVWVIDNVIDPAQVRATERRINWIEDRFDALLKDYEAGILVTLAEDAAPDLLAALIDAVEALSEANYYPSELKRFRSVIAKAKGN